MTAIDYDTEFREEGPDHPIEFISLGMVRDDGAEYYAVSSEFDVKAVLAHPWLRANVWPNLPTVEDVLVTTHPAVKPRAQIAAEVAAFVLGVPNPELWASYCSYDHVVLCQLFGTMIGLPSGFPMFTNDVKSLSVRVGDPEWPAQTTAEHHALEDARHTRRVRLFLASVEAGMHYDTHDTAAEMEPGRWVDPR